MIPEDKLDPCLILKPISTLFKSVVALVKRNSVICEWYSVDSNGSSAHETIFMVTVIILFQATAAKTNQPTTFLSVCVF